MVTLVLIEGPEVGLLWSGYLSDERTTPYMGKTSSMPHRALNINMTDKCKETTTCLFFHDIAKTT